MSDAKIKDGIVSHAKVKKSVTIADEDAMDRHIATAKNAHAYRQQAPEITDIFLRICSYEYFYPQVPNSLRSGNIMTENPEAAAAHVMVNNVIGDFIERLSLSPMEKYREKVGDKLDNLIAQTLMDFFQEMGRRHACNEKICYKRLDLRHSAGETSTHGFAFDRYAKNITKDVADNFPLFLNIYERNLEKQLECAPEKMANDLQKQIDLIDEQTQGMLNPKIRRPGSEAAVHHAHTVNHMNENNVWHGGEIKYGIR